MARHPRRLFRFPWRTRADVARDVDEEVRFHLDARADELMAQGLAPELARQQAEREFGRVASARRELARHGMRHEQTLRLFHWAAAVGQDLRFATRQLRKNPGFAFVATVTLALGVGANTLAFSLLYGSLFRRLPFPAADRLAVLQVERHGADQRIERYSWTYRQFDWLRHQPSPLASIASFSPAAVNLSGTGEAEHVDIEVVNASYFPTLGVTPSLGRGFTPDEDATPNTHPVVVLSHALWRRRYGQDQEIIGWQIRANGVPLTVVGVMPAWFTGLSGSAEMWLPTMMAPSITFDRYLTSNDTFHRIVARVHDGLSPDALRAGLAILSRGLAAGDPTAEDVPGAASLSIIAQPLAQIGIDPARRRSVILLFGAVWLVLAVACVNLASLELARARVRARELAVRMALGAGRARLVRQLLTEAVLLAFIGCALGVALAVPAAALARRIQPVRIATWANLYNAVSEFSSIQLNTQVLAFAVLVSFATVTLVGLLPAVRASRPTIVHDLKQGTPGDAGAGWTLRRPGALAALTVLEVALALVLAVGAGLLLKSYAKLQHRSYGFDEANLVTFHISPVDPTLSTRDAPAKITPILERVQQMPEIESASVSMCTPFSARCGRQPLTVVGGDARGAAPIVGVHYVGADHFRTLRIPLRRGRAFTRQDDAEAPRVAVINEAAARRFFSGQDPIGRRIDVGGTGSIGADPWEIVGVVGDVTYWPVEDPPHADVYLPYRQFTYPYTYVMARTRVPLASLLPALKRAVQSVDPNLPIEDVRTMEERAGVAFSGRRFLAYVLSGFAALAFGLAAMGVYGVATYSVSQRSREMGIRLALGAAPADVFRLIVTEGAMLAAVGVGAGLLMALGATRALRAVLYAVSATDPPIYLAAIVVVGLAASLATVTPARRATRVDPISSLKAE